MTAVYAEPVSNSAYLCLQSNQDIAWRPVSAGVTPTVVSGNGTYQVTYQLHLFYLRISTLIPMHHLQHRQAPFYRTPVCA